MVNYCKSHKCLVGKTAIVTGANSGIGFATSLEFAKRGCRVILACRSEERATKARDDIVQATSNQSVIVKILDLESFESVRAFARDIIATEPRLDLLVNNAGSVFPEKITADGLQLGMEVNYFSHFLLTNLLLDLLKKSAPSRVINVASAAARYVKTLDLEKLNEFSGDLTYYSKTKLCNVLFNIELAKRLEGTNVTAYSLCPGVVHTEAQKKYSKVLDFIAGMFFKAPEQGAQTSLYVSLEDGIEEHSGKYFTDCKVTNYFCTDKDAEKAKQLWEVTEKIVGLKNQN